MLSTENIGLKKPGYNDEADIAVINENSDIIDREFGNRYLKSETYSVEQANNAIAQAIEALPNGLVYRGAVNYYKDLPTTNNELGDTYSVKYQGETGTTADGNEYAWGEYDGALQWIKLGVNAYTKDEIDEQHEVIKSDILKAQKQTGAIAISSIGWYRIFKADRLGASRSSIIRLARGYNSKPAETITLFFNLQYNTPQQKLVYCNIINKFCHYQSIDKIRVVVPANFGVNDIVYIDLHHNASVSNPIQATMFDETVQPSSYGFFSIVNLEPVAENIEGYTSIEYDLTGKDVFERLDALETALSQTTE